MWKLSVCVFFLLHAGIAPVVGEDAALGKTPLEVLGWSPGQFFDHPDSRQLCDAIAAGDLGRVAKIAAETEVVSLAGRGGVTPLAWAMWSEQPAAFRILLALGADPTVRLDQRSSLPNTHPDFWLPGTSVVFLACRHRQSEYFFAVFESGVDVNIKHPEYGMSALQAVCEARRFFFPESHASRVVYLVEKGCDPNFAADNSQLPLVSLCAAEGDVLMAHLLTAGADPSVYLGGDRQLIHLIAGKYEKRNWAGQPPRNYDEWAYLQVIHMLENQGFRIDDAIEDLRRAEAGETVDGLPYMQWRRRQREEQGLDSAPPSRTSPGKMGDPLGRIR